jgi:hypothetical protein
VSDTEPRTAGGKVLWHFTMSLDGFVAGPNHEMDWMTGCSLRPGLVAENVETRAPCWGSKRLGPLPARRQRVRRCLGRTALRAHPPPRGHDTRRRSHVPELWLGRGGADRAGGGRRQEPRGEATADADVSCGSTTAVAPPPTAQSSYGPVVAVRVRAALACLPRKPGEASPYRR